MSAGIINFYSENDFNLDGQEKYADWLRAVIASEGKRLEEISYVFCDDEYLLKINQQYLQHDFYTDIISFDNSVGEILEGDIFVSTERVAENANQFGVNFLQELRRVMVHGILHLSGFKDKTDEEALIMRAKEEEKMDMFHVEQ